MSREVHVVRINGSRSENLKAETNPLSKEVVIEKVRCLVENMLLALVDFPKKLSLSVQYGENTVCFKIDCAKEDIGRILGKNGKMISSIRNISLGLTSKFGYRSVVETPYYPLDDKECKAVKSKEMSRMSTK